MLTKVSRKRRRKLLFIVNTAHFFISHRLPLAIAALKKGFDVHVAAPGSQDERQLVVEAGCDFHTLPFARGNAGFMAEAWTFARIALLVARTQPDVLHAVTIKPVIYGGLAARLLGVGGVLYAITGLRYRAHCATKSRIRKVILMFLTKLALLS